MMAGGRRWGFQNHFDAVSRYGYESGLAALAGLFHARLELRA
jgi:hypothetical protein